MFPKGQKKSVIIMTDFKTKEIERVFGSQNTLIKWLKEEFSPSEGYLKYVQKTLSELGTAYLSPINKQVTRYYVE